MNKITAGLKVVSAALLLGSVSVTEAIDMPGVKEDQKFSSYHEVGYEQSLRPQFHFSSLKGWVNDPNGLVYSDGEWHMCFQHLPPRVPRGKKHWGNAVSTDLFHWEQLPHAIVPYAKVNGKEGIHQIYSGSAVVDVLNALGKQEGDVKTLFALYSAVAMPEGFFQGGAYSTDRGRTWTKINGGKAVIPHQEGFAPAQRDPRIFYYAPGKCYVTIMMVGGPESAVRLWKSTDLLNWEHLYDIPKKSAECIDMFEVAVDGDPNNKRWVITSAHTPYEVGEFTLESWKGDGGGEKASLKFDYGSNFYAAQAFNQGPDGRVVNVGWLRCGNEFPKAGMPFTQFLSIPGEITLRTTPEGIRLFRNPVKEIEKLYIKTDTFKNLSVKAMNEKLKALSPELIDMTVTFAPKGDLTLNVHGMPVIYYAEKQEFMFRNLLMEEGRKEFLKKKNITNEVPNGRRFVPAPTVDGKVKLRVLVDRTSLELFINDGSATASFFYIVDPEDRSISIDAADDKQIESVVVNELKSVWGKK